MVADAAIDSLGMREHILGRPERVLRILDAIGEVEGLPSHESVANVVILGIGEAALAGDLVSAVAGPFMAVPVLVHRGADLPSFVGPDTLVVVLSASGGSDETIIAAEAAFESGASMLAITRIDGRLAELAASWRIPLVGLPVDVATRLALTPLVVAALVALEQIGLYPGARQWIASAAVQLARRRDQVGGADDVVRGIARTVGRTMPVIYGAGPVGAVAALRWKQQFNLSAKIPAFFNSVPELCHNEIAGWGQHGDVTRQVFTRIDLRHDDEHPHDHERFERVADLTLEVVADVVRVDAAGEGTLAQLVDLVFIGDLVAVELALAEGVDPGPTPAVDAVRAAIG